MTTQTVKLQIGDTSTVVDAYMTESKRPATTCYNLCDILAIDIERGNVTRDKDRDVYVCTAEYAEWLFDVCRKISGLHRRIDCMIDRVAEIGDLHKLTESEAIDVLLHTLERVDFADVAGSIDGCNIVLNLVGVFFKKGDKI